MYQRSFLGRDRLRILHDGVEMVWGGELVGSRGCEAVHLLCGLPALTDLRLVEVVLHRQSWNCK